MHHKILTYSESVELVHPLLSEIDNLSEFCRVNDLNYQSVLHIKNQKTDKQYPNTLKALLEKVNFEVSIERAFIVKRDEKF